MCALTGEDPEIYQIWTLNQANQNDWPKRTWKKCPIKEIQTATRMQLSLSLSLSLSMCPVSTCTVLFFPPKTLLSLYFVGILLLQSQRARALSLSTGLAAGVWRSHHGDPTSISGYELKPHFKLLQAETTRDQEYIHKHLLLCGLFDISLPKSNHLCVNPKASVLNLAKLRNRPGLWLSQQDIASLFSYILDLHSNLNTHEYFNLGRD